MMMEYNTETLCKMVDDYFAGIISRTALGEWAKSAYYDLLKGGYIECEKIVIYPFLKVISTFHVEENEMREYKIVSFKCGKGVKVSELYAAVAEHLTFHKVLFDAKINKDKGNGKITDCLSKYYHTVMHGLDKRPMEIFSNLNSAWEHENKSETASLTEYEREELIKFADRRNANIIIALDQVEWELGHIIEGTYGFEKASYMYGLTDHCHYLSNCIIIRKAFLEKTLLCYAVCEAKYRNSQPFNDATKALGEITDEIVCYAPEDEKERREWEKKRKRGKSNLSR